MKDKRTNAGLGPNLGRGGGSGGGGRGGGRTTRSTKISYPKNKTAKSVTRQLVKAENKAAKKLPTYKADRSWEEGYLASPTRRMTAQAKRQDRLGEKAMQRAEIAAAKEYSPPGRSAGRRNPNTTKGKKLAKPGKPSLRRSVKPKLPTRKVPARLLRSYIEDSF